MMSMIEFRVTTSGLTQGFVQARVLALAPVQALAPVVLY